MTVVTRLKTVRLSLMLRTTHSAVPVATGRGGGEGPDRIKGPLGSEFSFRRRLRIDVHAGANLRVSLAGQLKRWGAGPGEKVALLRLRQRSSPALE